MSEKIVPQPLAPWVCVISLPLVTHVSLNESISLCGIGWKKEMVSLKETASSSFLRLRKPFYLFPNFFGPLRVVCLRCFVLVYCLIVNTLISFSFVSPSHVSHLGKLKVSAFSHYVDFLDPLHVASLFFTIFNFFSSFNFNFIILFL